MDDTVEVIATRLDVGSEAVRARGAVLSDRSDSEHVGSPSIATQRFIIARGLLRELLAARLGVRPEAVELEYGVYGKPVLAPRLRGSGLRFTCRTSMMSPVYCVLVRRRHRRRRSQAVRPMPDAARPRRALFFRS